MGRRKRMFKLLENVIYCIQYLDNFAAHALEFYGS